MIDRRPTRGARFLLEREAVSEGGARARYRARIDTPDAEHAYHVELTTDGGATLEGGGVCPEHEDRLIDLARSIARAADRRGADGLAPWPERQTRWRGPGRG
jgi:hypothetical protein